MTASRRAFRALQHILNCGNQLRGVTADWGTAEALYDSLTLELIRGRLRELPGHPLDVLDAGCGIGRMAIDVAASGHRVTGIDVHRPSLVRAGRAAAEAGVPLELIQGDLWVKARALPAERYDVVLCMAVLYTCPDFRDIVAELARALRPGGLLLATFRPPFYFITTLLRQGKARQALAVARSSEGVLRIATAPSYYNWQTEEELAALYEQSGLHVVELRPLGVFSGTGYDGMAGVADPERLKDTRERAALQELEKDAGAVRGAGRYTLAVGRKR
jgi:2-polyprenyl-3-methyl-5-hydroxy-6-metoxy-1,4-benzoquinol methylase